MTSNDRSVVGGKRAVLEAIRAGVASEVLVSEAARRNDAIRDVLSSAARSGVPVTEIDRAELDAVAGSPRG